MTVSSVLKDLCRSFPGTTVEILWGDDLVFKIGGKMFAVFGTGELPGFSMKVPEELFHDMTRIEGVMPAPYLARAHWIKIEPETCSLDQSQLSSLLRQSYNLILAKLSKRKQAELVGDKKVPE